MATKTAVAAGGNASAGATWVGGVAPTSGDIIVVPANNPVTEVVWDSAMNAVVLGNNGSNVGDAFTIQGTNTTTYGRLRVPSGSILQTRGNGTSSNTMGLVNQYGQLVFESGSQCTGDPSGDYTTLILNKGILVANGATFTSTAGCYSWANQVTGASQVSNFPDWPYKYASNLGGFALNNQWIANAAGTGLGSFGDSSLSFTGSPSPALTTEVASISAINAAGKYWVDYELGFVIIYTVTNPTVSATYKYLANTKSWGISTAQNTAGNYATFDSCTFEYGGAVTESTGTKGFLHFANRQSDGFSGLSGNSSRRFSVTNNTFRYCSHGISLLSSNGTSADPLNITGNTFGECKGSSFGTSLYMFRSPSTYVNLSNNTAKSRGSFIRVSANQQTVEHANWTISNNTAVCPSYFLDCISINESGSTSRVCWPDSVMSGNNIQGYGKCYEGYMISGFGGKSGRNTVIYDNSVSFSKRAMAISSYTTGYRNLIFDCYHHHIVGPTSVEDTLIRDVFWYNNAASGCGNGACFQFGYNRRLWYDNVYVYNNTFNGGGVEFGDAGDNSGVSLISGAYVYNNIVVNSNVSVGVGSYSKPVDAAGYRTRAQITRFDHCSSYNPTNGHYTNFNGPAQFTRSGARYNEDGTRNCLGLTLQNPSYTTDQASGRTLTYTITAAGTNETVSWDGGTAAQLILANRVGSVSVDAVNTLIDAGASFNTAKNGAASPFACWLKITSGSQAGTVRAITNVQSSTKLTVTPPWTYGFMNGATNASPIVVSSVLPHGLTSGATVWINGVTGNTAANGTWVITVTSSTQFSLTGSTGNGAYTGNPGTWSAIPASTDSYAIYKVEVTCPDSGGTLGVDVGVDPRYLPASSQSDTGITIVLGRIESDPKLVAGTNVFEIASANDLKFTAGSPVQNAGTSDNAPSTDYYGTTRPQGAGVDIGFYEAIVSANTPLKRWFPALHRPAVAVRRPR